MAVSPNTVLGKYRILREIARSNDIVYEAIDPKMNRRVAVKELQLPLHLAGAQKRERVERFYREAKAAGTLTHPNIVTIHEVGQENDRHFLVMEYLDGQSLRDILQLQGALPLKETVEIALQMCDALSYAHAHGVVHRDVKPDNIHILPGGIIKLTDFGIARITAEPSITSQGQVFGTPSYMSPEQVASQAVDHRTDLFSMAITLYEMLTGRKPFVGDSVITITYNIMNSQPPMPVGIPTALQNILQKGLAKDANLRYQSAAAMGADLRAEKFALASPQSANDYGRGKLGGLGVTVGTTPGTLDTGHIPPAIAPFPGVSGQQAAAPYPMSPPPTAPSDASSYQNNGNGTSPDLLAGGYAPTQIAPTVGGLGPQDVRQRSVRRRSPHPSANSMAGLIFAVIGLLAVAAAIIYGIVQAYGAIQARSKRAEATHYTNQAVRALNGGNYEAAANSYQAAQFVAPTNTPEAHAAAAGLSTVETRRAQQEASAGDTTGAQSSYDRAIALNQQNAEAYDGLGNQRSSQRDENGAIDAWQSAVRSDATSPAAADARSHLTQIYKQKGNAAAASQNWTEARNDWQQIIAVSPGSPEAQEAQNSITASPLPGMGGAH